MRQLSILHVQNKDVKCCFLQMIGLLAPTSGTAFIGGLDIRTDMDKIYTSMGVCPQHE